jgi:hypothetical protein
MNKSIIGTATDGNGVHQCAMLGRSAVLASVIRGVKTKVTRTSFPGRRALPLRDLDLRRDGGAQSRWTARRSCSFRPETAWIEGGREKD